MFATNTKIANNNHLKLNLAPFSSLPLYRHKNNETQTKIIAIIVKRLGVAPQKINPQTVTPISESCENKVVRVIGPNLTASIKLTLNNAKKPPNKS